MAQNHTALRVIRGLLGKCQRGSHRERHLPPHPVPLPLRGGEGARRAGEGGGSWAGRILRWLAQPRAASARRTSRTTGPAAGCSLSLWEGQGEGIGLPFDTATWTLSEIVEPRESTGSAGGFP